MVLSRSIFFILICLIMLTLMYAFIPEGAWNGDLHDLPVYNPTSNSHLEKRLVDFLVTSPLSYRVLKVQLIDDSLRLDIAIDQQIPTDEEIMNEMAHFILEGFQSLHAIEDIWARILYRNNGSENLIIGIMANRNNINLQKAQELNEQERIRYVMEKSQITYGAFWRDTKSFSP